MESTAKEYSELPKTTNDLIRSCQPIRKGHITIRFFRKAAVLHYAVLPLCSTPTINQ